MFGHVFNNNTSDGLQPHPPPILMTTLATQILETIYDLHGPDDYPPVPILGPGVWHCDYRVTFDFTADIPVTPQYAYIGIYTDAACTTLFANTPGVSTYFISSGVAHDLEVRDAYVFTIDNSWTYSDPAQQLFLGAYVTAGFLTNCNVTDASWRITRIA